MKTEPRLLLDRDVLGLVAEAPAWTIPAGAAVFYGLIYVGSSVGAFPALWLEIIRDHATGLFR